MRHAALFLALGICSAQTVPLTCTTTEPEGDLRRPDFTVDAGAPIVSLAYSADGNTLESEDAMGGVTRKVLVFWRADAIQHKAGVPAANKTIELLARRTGAFQADFSRDYDVLDPDDPRAIRRDYNEQHGASGDSGRTEESGAARLC